MNDVPEKNDVGTTSDPLRYNATPCAPGKFTSATTPDIYDAITQAKQICTRGALCPNGDKCTNLGGCIVPADANASSQCLASKLTAPALTLSSQAVPLMHPKLPALAEGRAFNQHLYHQIGAAGGYQLDEFATPLPVTGAFYRIHTNHSLNRASTSTSPIVCGNPSAPTWADMGNQISCLVNASPCSLGSGGGTNLGGAVGAIKINGQSPLALCVGGDCGAIPAFSFPLGRKLYLDTLVGFGAVTGNEQALAGCETDLAQTQPPLPAPSPAGIMAAQVPLAGFLPISACFNNGEPFCEDFNEHMLCGAATNVQSCGSVPPNYSAFPTNFTTCGDGVQEAFEDCDCGVSPSPGPVGPPSNVANCGATFNGGTVCTTTCRFAQ
jgi:hypothetical protein